MNKHSFSNCESTIGKYGICAAYLNKMNIKQTWFQMSSAPKDGTMILVAFRTYCACRLLEFVYLFLGIKCWRVFDKIPGNSKVLDAHSIPTEC